MVTRNPKQKVLKIHLTEHELEYLEKYNKRSYHGTVEDATKRLISYGLRNEGIETGLFGF